MSFIRSINKTVTLSTVGAYSGYSTQAENGVVCGTFISISKAIGASGKITITGGSTQKFILTVVDPSTLGAMYYPFARAMGSTANVLASSAPVAIPLMHERVKIKVASSSGLAGASVVATVFLR